MRFGMAIDTRRCVGCNNCSVSCKIANNLSRNLWWSRVLTVGGDAPDTPAGTYPRISQSYLTLNCQHCENPACTRVCPVGATFKNVSNGVVQQDYDKCIGCRMCIAACPYVGVRSFNWEKPAYPMDYAVGDADSPVHQMHVVEKCQFCSHRLVREGVPACMDFCPARARHYGDLDDPDSEISQLIASRKWEQLLPDRGTNPSVYYLV